jgi:hypothetical protein
LYQAFGAKQAWQASQLADLHRLYLLQVCNPCFGCQGEPLFNTRHQAIYRDDKNHHASDDQRCCRKGLLLAVSELNPLDNTVCHAGGQKAVPWALSTTNTEFDRVGNRDTKVRITNFSASAVVPNDFTGLPGNCPQFGLAAAPLTASKSQPSGPTTTPKLPARAQWNLADTCKDEAATCAVQSLKLPMLLAPHMQNIFPGNLNTTVNVDSCAWQSDWFVGAQVGEQIHGLQALQADGQHSKHDACFGLSLW